MSALAPVRAERRTPKRHRMADEQVRAIHAGYLKGGSIDELAAAIGFTGSTARRQMHKRDLPLKGQPVPVRAEQQAITTRLVARVHELRAARGLTVEGLAHQADLSTWTLHRMAEHGSDPRLTTVLRLCRGLDVTAGELLDDLPLPIEARPRYARGYSPGQELTP
jgi:DNA-binding Xre family transcriptional regulator